MMFHAPTGQMVLPPDSLKQAAMLLRYSLAKVREAAKLPLDRYEGPVALKAADHAQISILEAAEVLGIDLGMPRMRYYELDLRSAG